MRPRAVSVLHLTVSEPSLVLSAQDGGERCTSAVQLFALSPQLLSVSVVTLCLGFIPSVCSHFPRVFVLFMFFKVWRKFDVNSWIIQIYEYYNANNSILFQCNKSQGVTLRKQKCDFSCLYNCSLNSVQLFNCSTFLWWLCTASPSSLFTSRTVCHSQCWWGSSPGQNDCSPNDKV